MKPVTVAKMKPIAAAKLTPLAKLSSSQKLKSKFFNMIGIESSPHYSSSNNHFSFESNHHNIHTSGRNEQGMISPTVLHPRMVGIVSSQEDLKYNHKDDLIHLQSRGKTNDDTESGKKKITFDDVVKVLPIPKRNEYSSRISRRLWSGAVEIHENAARNSVEFAAEGWDWRTVTEDDKMYICYATGERIHPVHYENFYMVT